ncbi:MAG: zinc ribbon domain-containing protein [Mariniphaga sp.]
MKYCPQCGKELVPGDRFCAECGFETLVTNQPVNNQIPPVQPQEYEQPRFVPPTVTNAVGSSTTNTRPIQQNSTSSPNSSGKSNILSSLLIVFVCLVVLVGGGWLTYTQLLKDQPIEEAAVAAPENNNSKVQPSVDNSQISEPVTKIVFVYTVYPTSTEAEKQGALQVRKDNYKDKNPDGATRLVIKQSSVILKITTDHYNESKGTTNVGSITITGDGGMVIGTYQARGKAGTDGTTNGKWVAEPQVRLDPGVYYIQDSEPSTWSKNAQGVGLLNIEGYEISK